MNSFRNLNAYIKAKELVSMVYALIKKFPKEEQYALCDQLRRAVISIPSNIAEGSSRTSEKDFAHFLEISLGSSFEVETQLLISKNLHYISEEKYIEIMNELAILQKQLNNFIQTIRLKANS